MKTRNCKECGETKDISFYVYGINKFPKVFCEECSKKIENNCIDRIRVCKICKNKKVLTNFSLNKGSYSRECKQCNKIRRQPYFEEYKTRKILIREPEEKICKKCNLKKKINEFYTKEGGRRRQSRCKSCSCEESRLKTKYNKTIKDLSKEIKLSMICSKCKIEKIMDEFSWRIKYKTKRKMCKICVSDMKKIYKEKNKERFDKLSKEYYLNNKTKIIKDNTQRAKNRRKVDIGYKIMCNCRSRLQKYISGKAKSDQSQKLIGCTRDFLVQYLESKFTEGMSWGNYGNPNGDHSGCWHIDHIRPCSSFDFTDTEQQKKCFNYTNLQPMWAIDNIKKSDRII